MSFSVDAKRFQCRIRTSAKFEDIEPIKDWIDATRAAFAFHHNLPDNSHYHIYFFGLEREADSMRKKLGRYYPKENYSVSTTCKGRAREPIIDWLAWQYGTTEDLLTPVFHKGFNEQQIAQFMESAERYYDNNKKDQGGTLDVVNIVKEEHYIVRPDRVWERLSSQKEEYSDLTLREIKSKMVAQWLNAGKAMPRPSDLHRYAVSLYMLNKYDGEVPADGYIKFENGE